MKASTEKGRLTYGVRIENVSPLLLNGIAAVGIEGDEKQAPHVVAGMSIPPRRSMTFPATEEAVKQLGLRRGIRITALDLSAL